MKHLYVKQYKNTDIMWRFWSQVNSLFCLPHALFYIMYACIKLHNDLKFCRNKFCKYKNIRKSFGKNGLCFIVESAVSHVWRDSEERPKNSPHGPRSETGWGKWFYQVVAKAPFVYKG